ncbi:hypothetical protein L3X38_023931 [Prunus dulcis]|uniref:Uncharacterized protein n=1 Tax=Prunus dulcis TaxID=3755 RepID=A0AAD4W0G3_PRUDU|nr:hypothetical protein L3X38_023931 [Prunus dulcis]
MKVFTTPTSLDRVLEPSPDMKESVMAVEKIVGYNFKNKKLLEEALTHPSFAGSASYQRLEVLGDSALNHAVTNYFFCMADHQKFTQGQITKLRSANAENLNLARVAVHHGLYRYLRRHNTADLDDQVREFTEAVINGEEEPGLVYCKSEEAKVLADIVESVAAAVESVAAAVYIELNFDLDRLWMKFKPLLEPIFTLENLHVHPTTELNEFCQKNGKRYQIKLRPRHETRDVSIADVYVDGEFVASDFVASLLFIGIEMDSVETNNVKPGKFNGTNFKRWQRQLKYWLTVLGLDSALEDQTTPDKTTETTSKTKEKMTKEELEYHCHNRILSALADDLYDVYQDTKKAKTLWDELEAEYGIEDAGIDRFTISNFNNYMMVENKTVSEQIHEYQDFLRKIELKGTKFSEEFKVSCLIDKLPPSWSNFAKTLRHKQGVLTLTQVLNSLWIEEKHKSSNKPKEEKTNVNLVESSNNRNRFQSRRKSFKRINRNSQPNHNQFNRNQNCQHNRPHNNSNGNRDQPCFVCGRTNHWAKDCHYKKTKPYKPKPKWNKGQSGPKAQVNVLVDQDDQDEPNLRYSFKPLVNVAYLSNSDWWLDSGANVHVCFDKRFFKNYQNSSGGSVTLGNDTVAQVRGIGEVELKMTSGKTLTLKDVRHVPEVRRNLISGSSLVKQGYKIVMESNRIVITRNDIFIGKGYVCDGLFKINVVFEDNKISPQVFNVESCNVWHGRLGHVSLSKIKTLMDLELIPKSNIDLKHKCEVCVQAKQTRNSFKPVERNTQILELIHSDVCDSNRSPTRGGNKYFVTFIDDFSRYCHIYLIKTKDEVFNKLKIYKNEVENQLEKKIKRLRSDRGGEYTSNELGVFCEEHGIIHEVTPPYSPQSNGVAERKNRTLMDMVNSMLLSSGLPENLWGEVMLIACFILNRITLKDNEKTPYELWKRRSPNLRILKVWGCLAKVLIPDPKRKKIGPKTIDAVFLGYAKNSSANRFLVINSEVKEVANNTIMEARDATFFEDIFPYKTRISKEVQISEKPSSSTMIENLETQELRRSKRVRVEKNFGDDFYTFLVEGDPTTYKEAVMSVDAPF